MGKLEKDPVCGMDVQSHEISVVFLGIEYGFCSVQCRDRFMAHPHLYTGLRGQKSPRQRGLEVLKRRCLRLPVALLPDEGARVAESLRALMGIKAVEVRGDTIVVVYDLLQVTAEQIEHRLAWAGVLLGGRWITRMHRALVQYEEECEAANLELHPPLHHHHG